MNQKTAKRLHDAAIALARIQRYVVGRSFAEYEADDYFRSAVERQFEILAESLNVAARYDTTLEDRIPEIRVVVGLRNRIAHEYDELDDQVIWDTINQDLDGLSTHLSDVVEDMPPPD
jgi:uncharacterized protein with HEPN domain